MSATTESATVTVIASPDVTTTNSTDEVDCNVADGTIEVTAAKHYILY